MKKLFGRGKSKREGSAELKSLDDVLKDKDDEKKKLEEEENEYKEKRKERAKKIIAIEREELGRREEEVDKLKEDCCKVKKKNSEAEDVIQANIKSLQLELDDLRIENRSQEGALDQTINCKLSTIMELRQSIERRQAELVEPDHETVSASAPLAVSPVSGYPASVFSSAPQYPDLDTVDTEDHLKSSSSRGRSKQRSVVRKRSVTVHEQPRVSSTLSPPVAGQHRSSLRALSGSSETLDISYLDIIDKSVSEAPTLPRCHHAPVLPVLPSLTSSNRSSSTYQTPPMSPSSLSDQTTTPDLPSVPDTDPEEEDVFVTIQRPKKTKKDSRILEPA